MKKSYLVTGAAGFIGSALSRRILNEGHNVVSIDNCTTGKESNVPNGVEFFFGDCQSVDTINKLNNYKFEAVFHMAGQSSGEISFEDPVYDLQTNTQSTLLLLELCKKTGCSNFIYASSMSVYGDQDILPVSEDAICKPKSFYAVGKLASENYMKLYSEKNIKTTALRFFNVYGPGQNLNNMKQGMISIFLSMALKDKHIKVKGDPYRFRDFIYIDDLVDGIWKSINRKGLNFEVINLCSGRKTYVKEVLQNISKNLAYNIEVDYIENTPGDQFGIYGCADYANKIIDWKTKINFNDGMEEMINWSIKNLYE